MNSPLAEQCRARTPTGQGGPWYGVYPATVTDIVDPDGQGRVKVHLPWLPGDDRYEHWARLATFMAGANRGSWFIPDVGDEVLVAFAAGDARHPFVVGALWNGQDSPPETMDSSGRNTLKVLRSRNGVQITLDDEDGRERFHVETPGGQKLTLSDGPGVVNVEDANGNSMKFEAAGITINAAAKVTLNAGASVDISAGSVNINAGVSSFSGIVRCPTLIADSVISASYTPGAGNIW